MPDPLDPAVTEALRSWRIQLASGIASNEALDLSGRICKGAARKFFLDASKRTSDGAGIQNVLEALAPILTEGERATIVAGWSAGRTEAALDLVVNQRVLWRDARRRIISKLPLPVGFLIFASFVIPLPGLLVGGDSVLMYLIYVTIPIGFLFSLLIACVVFFRARATESVMDKNGMPLPASQIDKLLLAIPLCAYIEKQRSLAEFGALLSSLLGAGVPILQALDICVKALRNGLYREAVVRIRRSAEQGQSVTRSFQEEPSDLWPPEFVGAIAVGEQAGDLDAALNRVAITARENYTRAIERFADFLPRFIYGLVAAYMIFNIFKLAFAYVGILNGALKDIP